MVIALTGHRPNKLGNEWNHSGPVSQTIIDRLIGVIKTYKPERIITGMALGADTLWCMAGLTAGVSITAAIPFKGQESKWPLTQQFAYYDLLRNPLIKPYIVSKGGYSAAKMQVRNEWMVNNCDMLVALFDGTTGGTYNCVAYAEALFKAEPQRIVNGPMRKILTIVPTF